MNAVQTGCLKTERNLIKIAITMKITIINGQGKPVNPETKFIETISEIGTMDAINPIWQEFENEHPSLPALTPSGEVAKDGKAEAMEITQRFSHVVGWVNESDIDDFTKFIRKSRQVYLTTDVEGEQKAPWKWKCHDCGTLFNTNSNCPACHSLNLSMNIAYASEIIGIYLPSGEQKDTNVGEMEKAVDGVDKQIKYEFEVVDGKLTCMSHTRNVSFEEVHEALIMVKDHINRHIEKQQECPFHPSKSIKP